MSALEKSAGPAGPVLERGGSWLWFGSALVGFGAGVPGAACVRLTEAGMARSITVPGRAVFAAAVLAGVAVVVGVVCPGTVRRAVGGE